MGREDGDSGEELGEVSVIEVVSKVEIVVVGEESVDSEMPDDETLLRCSKERGGCAVDTGPLF